jgi:hypothetical protein
MLRASGPLAGSERAIRARDGRGIVLVRLFFSFSSFISKGVRTCQVHGVILQRIGSKAGSKLLLATRRIISSLADAFTILDIFFRFRYA